MKEQVTLGLSRHQAKILNIALQIVRQLVDLPSNVPVYNLQAGGLASALAKDEFALLQEEVSRQLKEQDGK